MRRRSKVPIVLAALLFILAAVAEFATGRRASLQDDTPPAVERAASLAVVTF